VNGPFREWARFRERPATRMARPENGRLAAASAVQGSGVNVRGVATGARPLGTVTPLPRLPPRSSTHAPPAPLGLPSPGPRPPRGISTPRATPHQNRCCPHSPPSFSGSTTPRYTLQRRPAQAASRPRSRPGPPPLTGLGPAATPSFVEGAACPLPQPVRCPRAEPAKRGGTETASRGSSLGKHSLRARGLPPVTPRVPPPFDCPGAGE